MFANICRLPALFLMCVLSAQFAQATESMTASPATINFTYVSGTTTPVSQTIAISSSVTTDFAVSVSPVTLAYYVTIPTSGATNTSITLTLQYPQYFTTPLNASITLTPVDTTVAALTIPIVINPTSGSQLLTSAPASVTYSYAPGTSSAISQYITVSGPYNLSLTASISSNLAAYFSVPAAVSSNSQFALTLLYPQNVTTTTSGYLFLAPPIGSGLTTLSIPITVNPAVSSGSTISATPASLTYSFATGSTAAITQYVQLSAATTASVTLGLSSELAAYFSLSASATSNSQIAVTLTSPQYFTTSVTGYLTATPTSGSGLSTATIPITVTPSGSTSNLTASPSSLTFSYTSWAPAAITQYLQVTSTLSATLTLSLSSNLSPYFSIPASVATNTQFAVTLLYPQSVASGTTGYLTLTPPPSSGLAAISVPIFINTSSSGGTISATPSSLAFTARVGGTAPDAQTVTLVAIDNSSQFVSATASSVNNFLAVTQTSFTTPTTLRVRVDPTYLTTSGTYTGSIAVTLANGTTAATIPVSVNVLSNVTVTPSPSAVSLTSAAGASTSAQTSVALTSNYSNFAFTASAATSSGLGWLSVSPLNGTLGNSITISANAQGLYTGTYTGTITITCQSVEVATIPVTFTVTPAAALQLGSTSLTFDYQTTSTSLPASQTVQVTSSASALNWTASATSTGGWLQVTPSSGSTGSALTIGVSPSGLAAGTYTGQVSVASSGANNSPQTLNVKLTVTTPAVPLISSVLNAASFAPSLAAPGEIVTIRGTDLGPSVGVSGTVDYLGNLSTALSTTSVLFDGTPAPILYASSTQINAVVPYEIANRVSTKIQVSARGQTSRELELRVADTAPGLFTSPSGGTGQGAITNQNGTVNSATNPEQRGNIIALYGTGHGQTNPAGVSGAVYTSSPLRRPLAAVSVWIGGQPAEVLYAGSAPGMIAGALQINVRIPQTAGTGSLPVTVQIGNATTPSGVTVAVQ